MKDKLGIFWIKSVNDLRIKYLRHKVNKLKKQIYDIKYRADGRAVAAYWRNRSKRLETKRKWQANNLQRRKLQYEIRKLKYKLEKVIQHKVQL